MNNGFGIKRALRYLTGIVKTVFLRLINYIFTVTTNIKKNISLELYHSIKKQDQKEQFKVSYICHETILFTISCTGHIMGRMTSTYMTFTSIIMYCYIIDDQRYHYGITPLELLTRNKADHLDLSRSHVWGCPVFVLDP